MDEEGRGWVPAPPEVRCVCRAGGDGREDDREACGLSHTHELTHTLTHVHTCANTCEKWSLVWPMGRRRPRGRKSQSRWD